MWTLEVFEADDGTIPYERFISDLSDVKFAAKSARAASTVYVTGLNLLSVSRQSGANCINLDGCNRAS